MIIVVLDLVDEDKLVLLLGVPVSDTHQGSVRMAHPHVCTERALPTHPVKDLIPLKL